MREYQMSTWLNSSGGPFVMMEEARASSWMSSSERPSDFDLACQLDDYAAKLVVRGADVLVLGDEPLQTAIATSDTRKLVVRWKWADGETEVLEAIEKIDFSSITIIEKVIVNWASQPLVIFDAAFKFDVEHRLKLVSHKGPNEVSTFVYAPTSRISLLIHSVAT